MSKTQKEFFIKSEDLFKTTMKKFKEDGETDETAIVLAIQALTNIYKKNGLTHNYYTEILKDIETIYTSPIETYKIYRKYGIFDKEE